ncbi:PAS domain-containing protein [Sneathiella aquimaris]|uniref:PAS domain-containing protein n=1 Tax=Sneathiella aquimaris TaxID=2599305 RepID=UPI00146DCA3D|nr:PAS domain-containing protein [Sneathiella aquimaris]
MEQDPNRDLKREENFNKVERVPALSADQFVSPLPRRLFEWWAGFAPALPSRTDFDITQHRSLPANIFLIEVLGPGHFLYRLHGDTVADLIGRRTLNHEFSDENGSLDDRLLAKHMRRVATEKVAYQCFGDLAILDKEFINFESVDCPLENEDGIVTHILGVFAEVR